jgi:translocation protein SEC66
MPSSIPLIIACILIIIFLSYLTIFTLFYHHRKATLFSNLEPLFKSHTSRDIYLSLIHLNAQCPTHILQAALLDRAKEDISRIYILQKIKGAARSLLQKGHITQVIWTYLQVVEAELIDEIEDVQAEARGLRGEDWGDIIMIQANEYFQKCFIIKSLENLGLDLREGKILLNEEEIEKRRSEE